MQRVLFVGEGNDAIAALSQGLEAEGYRTALCPPGEEGAALAGEMPADVLVVDLTGEEGKLSHLWQEASGGDAPPIIALVDESHLVQHGVPYGIDDFLVLPATAAQLSARICQALRRRLPQEGEDVLRCGELVIDVASYRVLVGTRLVNLTYKEYELLRFLATNSGRVFTREALLNQVWGYDYYGGARIVDVHIRRLRSKIEDSHRSFIETVRNVGYRFQASLRR